MFSLLMLRANPVRRYGVLPAPAFAAVPELLRRSGVLCPNEAEREGNGPNLAYSGGARLPGGELIIPDAMSDSATSFVSVSLAEWLAAME